MKLIDAMMPFKVFLETKLMGLIYTYVANDIQYSNFDDHKE